jgi:hypothetical protein
MASRSLIKESSPENRWDCPMMGCPQIDAGAGLKPLSRYSGDPTVIGVSRRLVILRARLSRGVAFIQNMACMLILRYIV